MSTSLVTPLVSSNENKGIEKDDELKHHIPSSLVDQIPRLSKVRLRKRLARFAQQYKDKEFVEPPEEYRMISKTISNMMLDLRFTRPVREKIDSVMKTQLAHSEVEDRYREHFVHPFQIFLMGMLAIDRHYELYRGWFSDELCKSARTSLESAWLLASIFHDHLKPIPPLHHEIESILDIEDSSLADKIPNVSESIDLIARTYPVLGGSKRLSRNVASNSPISMPLAGILREYAQKDNHGVLGGVNVLNWIRKSGHVLASDVLAALAITLHDGDYLHDRAFPRALLSAGIFPIEFSKHPVACLLLWCDAVQEWGRWTHRLEVDTRLVNVSFEDMTMNFRLSFGEDTVVESKISEISDLGQCIIESGVKYTIDFRVHPASLGARRRALSPPLRTR